MTGTRPHRSPRPPRHRPFVTANFALSWDARVTTRTFAPATFSSAADRRHMLELRARADAIMVGRRTLETDRTTLGLPTPGSRRERARRGLPPAPLRVIVTASGRLSARLPVFQRPGAPLVIFSTTAMPARTRTRLAALATLHLFPGSTVPTAEMLAILRRQYGVRTLLCEGGPSLLRTLIAADALDEINTTFCPLVFGGRDAPGLTGPPGDFLPATVRCRLREWRVIGGECFARYTVRRAPDRPKKPPANVRKR